MKNILTFLAISLVLNTTYAQRGYQPAYKFELGIQAGTAVFLGDLGGGSGVGTTFVKDADFKSIRPSVGLFAKWNLGAHFSARLDLNYLMLSGDDNLASDDFGNGFIPNDYGNNFNSDGKIDAAFYRFYRNLSFRSHVFEAAVIGEIIPYNFELGGGYADYSVLSPYALIGIGVFNFNPQALYDSTNSWIDLRPLATEGQGLVAGREPYSLTQIMIPIGFGLKWNNNDKWALSFEVNHRLTFTDYIDDVSTNYVDPTLFFDNMPRDQAIIAAHMARRSIEVDRYEDVLDGRITWPGQQRGNPKQNDSYFTATVKFHYFLDMGGFGGGRQYGCPVW